MDDSDQQGFRRVVLWLLQVAQIDTLVVTGDLCETWQFRLQAIMRHWAGLLGYLDDVAAERGVRVIVVLGNHDGNAEQLRAALSDVMPRTKPDVVPWTIIDGVLYIHGHQWDPVNAEGPQRIFARFVTLIASGLEWIGLNEQWLNPIAWDRMARRERGEKDALHLAILSGLQAWLSEHGIMEPVAGVCAGHTHLQETIGQAPWLVNAGSLERGHHEAALIVDGSPQVINFREEIPA